jgi:hypothetical protein
LLEEATMKRTAALIAIALCAAGSAAWADYGVQDKGTWPESWPKELEPLRKQARTLEGPLRPLLNYAIPFAKREEFEAAWPHLLKVKTPGAPIVLRRGPSFWLEDGGTAGICIHTPPAGEMPGWKQDRRHQLGKTTMELIVDGQIADLNRMLPPDTPIIDERFKKEGVCLRQN